jgi:hypothetical protein
VLVVPGGNKRTRPAWRWLGQEVAMPSLYAGLLASLAGWLIVDLIQPFLGQVPAFVLSFVGSAAIFFVARKWLIDLRGR